MGFESNERPTQLLKVFVEISELIIDNRENLALRAQKENLVNGIGLL